MVLTRLVLYSINYSQELITILQVLTAMEFTTSIRNQAVKIRKEEHGLGSEEPLSVPTLLQVPPPPPPEVIYNPPDNCRRYLRPTLILLL